MDKIKGNGKMVKKEMVKDLRKYWDENVLRYGDSPKAFDWGSRESQNKRFNVLCELLPSDESFTVLDVGCGTGDLWKWMALWFEKPFNYTGVDISPKMIKLARKKDPTLFPSKIPGTFKVHDMAEPLEERYDYVLLSGTLNKRIAEEEEQTAWARRVIRNCWDAAEKGLAYNMLSTYADHTAPDDYQYNPCKILKYSMSLSRWAKLDHTYMPHDFTVYLWRNQH